MVSVVHSVAVQGEDPDSSRLLADALDARESGRLADALAFAREIYAETSLGSGEGVWSHALGIALIIAGLKLDADSRIAALLFAVPARDERAAEGLEVRFGADVARLVRGMSGLNRLRPITRDFVATGRSGGKNAQETRAQIEILRKMLLAMVEDIRVVLLRLASRTQTLRYYTAHPDDLRVEVARETLELYSPLANRLGVWELKWELEDLSFRFIHPDTYKKIAKMLDETRLEREQFIASAIDHVKRELGELGIAAEVYGRPKHIYSIWSKMRKKNLAFTDVYDVRALRVIVGSVKDCYAALGIVHNLWTPIPKEFDDYISNPKSNDYRSLHTAVHCPDGRSLEVQIRTWEMHRHAELGVAAHWRYKEGGQQGASDDYDAKISWLRQLLTWKEEVTDSSDWIRHYKEAALDETIYVLTPQGRVIDLPQGATPLDFAYRVHSDLGHRCRGAKIDGVLSPLNTTLKTGQRIEIITAKQGGPSRDWLNAASNYLHTKGARVKVRQWFASRALEETLSEGKALVIRELQRLGQAGASVEEIAKRLGFAKADDLFVAAARNELNLRQFQASARGESLAETPPEMAVAVRRPTDEPKGILIVGVDRLLTQLARCCKPAPPDAIEGFVTRGKGVSIHRVDCPNFQHLVTLHPERVIETEWGDAETEGFFAADIVVDAHDRQGLLRDISEIFAKGKINVTDVNTQSRQGKARMAFTVEIKNITQLQRTLDMIHDIKGVVAARRGVSGL
ncbi:MAG: bifunctional (p)ppGpp synthetase/guanosine-3',5'-bis(diphosphate) 3'-pyrophosphohydrolase [Zoogloeaceae bacterium]|jgi:GTP pyrophosphokinase|nr:bifunctional (p)ppGpp synthetase/guanosine-3',5'-bis(diphosphate) 3'-pyrophosphohydrolase [Zoogloeaceae bacterium]